MGRKLSGEEKRLRGFLSGDPDRVARTARRCIGIGSTEIHRYMAAHLDEIVEATGQLELGPQLQSDLDGYFEWLRTTQTFDPRPAPDPACECKNFRGDPNKLGPKVVVVAEKVFPGWSDMVVQCNSCLATRDVVEDAGYHFTQWHWSSPRAW